MSRALVVVPSAPMLLPEYTGRTDAAADLRACAVEALGSAVPGGGSVVLVVATDREQRGTRAPLGERVGRHLVELAGLDVADVVVVPWDASVADCVAAGESLAATHPDASVVVVADGSARRGEKAPGHLDERSFALDEALVGALRAADGEALLALDADLAADLLVHGRAPLQVAATLLRPAADGSAPAGDEGSGGAPATGSGTARCEALHTEDPSGVLHVVARLTLP
ncbi:hypothetical protein [Arthrobacter sp. NEB 688]|uniref:hypothetical protein n=1 Tax=Arthrobacter sp. NEB 688 TaxID=904039 RepID=UPI0015671765|nr:hypothetical protein [Arthrobacter sp. NEB 688]QKE82849.1 hypothetical protein HL663_02040 [Arthrobacter sp. NEB 688]